jgi:hypothetical protein
MRILPLLLVAAALPAQAVRLTNASGFDYDGWWRVTLTAPPLHAAGWMPNGSPAYYVAGEGEADEWPVDIRAAVPAGTTRILDLAAMDAVVRPVVRLDDLGALYAGQPLLNGLGITYTVPAIDAAGVTIRGHVAVAPDCLVVLAFRWTPEAPHTLVVTSRVTGTPPTALGLAWGDGQAWLRPDGWTVTWPRLYRSPADLQAAQALHTGLLDAAQL